MAYRLIVRSTGRFVQAYAAPKFLAAAVLWRMPWLMISRRRTTSPMSAGRLRGLILTHSITKFDKDSGTSGFSTCGDWIKSSARILFSPFLIVNSVGIFRPERAQY